VASAVAMFLAIVVSVEEKLCSESIMVRNPVKEEDYQVIGPNMINLTKGACV
jgi:hypothetical protein